VLLDRLAERRIGALHGRLACDAVWVRGGRRVRFAPPAPAAWGDVAEDVARLTLELRARGGARFAERLAAAHALAADDYGLYRVLGFYERDAACALALDGAGPAPRTWVEAALADAGRPRLVIAVGGGVASGKSRVAKAVAGRLAAPRVVAERVRAALHLPDPGEIAHELLWQPAIALRVHQGVFARAADVLASGRTVVLDASFESPARRAAAAALAAQQGARFVFVHCEPPAAAVEARLRARDVRDGNTLFGWHSLAADFAARFEPPAPDEAGEVLRLDTALPDSGWKALVAPRLATWGMPLAREPEA
jgi:hypothetical protein